MVQGVDLDNRKTGFWSEELKWGNNYFYNMKGFIAVNDKFLNIVWPGLESLKITIQLKSIHFI
jgi:hypothetical protein